MLCRRCKTAIDVLGATGAAALPTRCPVCGAKTRKGGGALMGLACFAAAVFCAGYMYADQAGYLDPPPESAATAEGGEGFNVAEAARPTAVPDLKADGAAGNVAGDAFARLEYIEKALSQYWYLNGASRVFVSRNGYFYDFDEGRFVTVADLVAADLLDAAAADKDALLLFLRPGSFRGYKEADFGISSDLRVFAAFDSAGGVQLFSEGVSGTLYREHFNEVMGRYAVRSATIYEPLPEDDEFTRLVMETAAAEGSGLITPRRIRADGKYCLFAFSYPGVAEIVNYNLLQLSDGAYTTVLRGVERYEDYIERINNLAPDFNFEMLSGGEDYSAVMRGSVDFEFIDVELKARESVEADDETVYVCGTDDALYMEYASGKKFFGVKTNDMWAVNVCKTRSEARERLSRQPFSAPLLVPLG